MKESPLINKSKAFALEVLKVCKELRATKCEGDSPASRLPPSTALRPFLQEAHLPHPHRLPRTNFRPLITLVFEFQS